MSAEQEKGQPTQTDTLGIDFSENQHLAHQARRLVADGKLSPAQYYSIDRILHGSPLENDDPSILTMLEPEKSTARMSTGTTALSNPSDSIGEAKSKKFKPSVKQKIMTATLVGTLALGGAGTILYNRAYEDDIPSLRSSQESPSPQMLQDLAVVNTVLSQNLNTQNDPEFWQNVSKLSRTNADYLGRHFESRHKTKNEYQEYVNDVKIETYVDRYDMRLPGNKNNEISDIDIRRIFDSQSGKLVKEEIRFYIDKKGNIIESEEGSRGNVVIPHNELQKLLAQVLSRDKIDIDRAEVERGIAGSTSWMRGKQEIQIASSKQIYFYSLYSDGSVFVITEYLN